VLDFVRAVTEPGEAFVSPDERIATFDNDRTLWFQRPMYPQADSLVRRWAEQVKADPSLAAQQPWKAGAAADHAWLASATDHVPELIRGVTEATDGITTVAFEAAGGRFFDTAQHPTLGVPYTQIAFRPMRELIKLLEAHDFTVCVCSAGGRDFVRVVSEEMYGIPRERVNGSGTTLEYRQGDVYRTQGVEQPIDDGPGKPVHIWTRTRRKPLLGGGNADGDAAMLESELSLLVRHDDESGNEASRVSAGGAREFAYDTGAERAQAKAGELGWTIVSMKNDFDSVF
jgi:hypothetical protein